MSADTLDSVHSHWDALHENLQASVQDFYRSIEEGLARRAIPNVRISRVEYKESGVLSANREYLRVEREQLQFDICGAPFGTGFFTSWWLAEPRLQLSALIKAAVLLGMFLVAGWVMSELGIIVGFLAVVAVVVGGVAFIAHSGGLSGDDAEKFLLAMPILGWLYRLFVKPETYYRMDSTLMFQEAVHNAVLEAVDAMTTSKGLRALADDQRKPIMRDFFSKRGSN